MAFPACYVDLGSRRFYAARRVVNLSGDTLDHCTPHYVFVYVERDRADNFPLPFLHSLPAVNERKPANWAPLLFIDVIDVNAEFEASLYRRPSRGITVNYLSKSTHILHRRVIENL